MSIKMFELFALTILCLTSFLSQPSQALSPKRRLQGSVDVISDSQSIPQDEDDDLDREAEKKVTLSARKKKSSESSALEEAAKMEDLSFKADEELEKIVNNATEEQFGKGLLSKDSGDDDPEEEVPWDRFERDVNTDGRMPKARRMKDKVQVGHIRLDGPGDFGAYGFEDGGCTNMTETKVQGLHNDQVEVCGCGFQVMVFQNEMCNAGASDSGFRNGQGDILFGTCNCKETKCDKRKLKFARSIHPGERRLREREEDEGLQRLEYRSFQIMQCNGDIGYEEGDAPQKRFVWEEDGPDEIKRDKYQEQPKKKPVLGTEDDTSENDPAPSESDSNAVIASSSSSNNEANGGHSATGPTVSR